MINFQQAEERFKEKGYRFSKTRNCILELLLEYNNPLSALEIQQILKKQKVVVNKTTIYREINLLKKEGIILEIQLNEKNKRYELSSKKHHHHIVCTNCNKIEDVVLDKDLETQEKKIEKNKKFKIINHSLEFFGICEKCQK